MRHAIALLLFIGVFMGAVHAAAQTPAATRTYKVFFGATDETGAWVTHAQIRIEPAPADAPKVMETGEDGRFSIKLPPGHYTFYATAPGFEPGSAQLDVPEHADANGVAPSALLVMRAGAKGGPAKTEMPVTSAATSSLILLVGGGAPVYFTLENFKPLPHTTLTIHNAHSNQDEAYSGVALSDLLAKNGVELGSALRGAALAKYIVAAGSDGYKVVLSVGEIDPELHPGQVLVADSMNGVPLDTKLGPFRLVVSEDKRPARCVRNLTMISVKSAE